MVTRSDFNSLRIKDFINDFARVFKTSDIQKAEQLGLNTVGDVLNDTRAGSCKSMKAKLRTYSDALVNIYNYLNVPYLLPAKADESMSTAEMFRQLLAELDDLVGLVKTMPFEQDTDGIIERSEAVLKVAKYRYLHNLSDSEIGLEIGLTGERCRTYHDIFIRVIKSGLTCKSVNSIKPFLLKFGLSQIFIDRLNSVVSVFKSGISLNILTSLIGTTDSGIVQFFLDFLGASLYSSANGTFKGTYVIGGFPITKFDEDGSVFFDLFSKEHEHINGIRIKSFLHKHLSSNIKTKAETLIIMADHSGQFDIIEKDGLKCYQLKYEYLKSDDIRNERILYENRGKFLSKAQMEDEYNRRARLYGMDEKKGSDYLIKGTEKIASQNSVWHWIEDGEKKISDPRPAIKAFVQGKGGIVKLDEVRDFVRGQKISLKDSTLRTYLSDFCIHHRKGDTYTVKTASSIAGRGDIAPDIVRLLRGSSKPVCVNKIATALGTTCARIERNIAKHGELFESVKKGRLVMVSLKPTYASKPIRVNPAGSRKEPKHRTYMRSMAIDILKKAGGGPLPMKEVADKISTVIAHTTFSATVVYKVFEHPIFEKGTAANNKNAKTVSLDMDVYRSLFEKDAEFAEKKVAGASSGVGASLVEYDWNKNYEDLKDAVISFTNGDPYCKKFNVSKSFDTMNDIMMGGKSSLNRDSYFWLIQELLYKYLTQKTTKIEREFLRDNLAYKYEAFLGNYYTYVTGKELGVDGLATRLGQLQYDGLLPARYSDWSSTYTSKLVKTRNKVHASSRDLDSTIKSEILQFLVLYLYTASLDSTHLDVS